MTDFSANNKRLAKNTLLLYFRMILIMLVTFYTSRIVLDKLGIEDFGIYNVVGGVVMMFAFLNSSMTTATQRFLTFELGKEDTGRLEQVFSAALNIHIGIAIIIVLLAETIGLWFLNCKMNIPESRIIAANWVYQFSLLAFCTNIVQVPYNASLIAHEKMNVFAYISILEVFLKLGIAYLLTISKFDRLILYGLLIFLVQFIIRTAYQFYCKRHYAECRFRRFWDKDLYRLMFGFASWNVFGSLAWLFRDQGINILLNLFFGPVVNAARGVMMQVSAGVMGFIMNFQTALNPQITKLYAVGEVDNMEKLVYRGLKYSFILLFFIALPLMLNVDYVLSIWLKEIPDYTSYFIILIMIDALVNNLFGNPLMTSLAATGKIRTYQIVVSFIILLIVPVGYCVLKMGYDAPSVFYVMILFTLISGFIRFLFCVNQIGFSIHRMINIVLIPLFGMVVFALPIPLYLRLTIFSEQTFFSFLMLCCISVFSVLICTLFIGLKKDERKMLSGFLKKKLIK